MVPAPQIRRSARFACAPWGAIEREHLICAATLKSWSVLQTSSISTWCQLLVASRPLGASSRIAQARCPGVREECAARLAVRPAAPATHEGRARRVGN